MTILTISLAIVGTSPISGHPSLAIPPPSLDDDDNDDHDDNDDDDDDDCPCHLSLQCWILKDVSGRFEPIPFL